MIIIRPANSAQIFVEVERARVTKILSDIKKEQGQVQAAADILCELQVETFGSMSRREKTEFILEQVALSMEVGDWTQAAMLSRKISTRYFTRKPKSTPEQALQAATEREEKERQRGPDEAKPEPADDVTDLKLRYYEQQISLAKHDDKYLDVCKHYRQILDTEAIENNPDQLEAVSAASTAAQHIEKPRGKLTGKQVLQRVIYFVILAPYDNEQSDLLQRVFRDSRNSQVETEAQLLKLFTISELMRWPLVSARFGPHLASTDIFDTTSDQQQEPASPVPGPGSGSGPGIDKASKRWHDLRKRVIEHNVRVIAKYYTRVHLSRLTELLDLAEDETEKYISELVTAKTIYARIDRPARLVSFAKPRDADDVLNEWSADMKSLLGHLERIDHLITKEEMMARIQPAKAEKGKAERAR